MAALVSEEQFAQAQEQVANQRHARRRTKEPTLLQGMLVCRRCGYAYHRCSTRKTKRKLYYYPCLGSDGWRYEDGVRCASHPVPKTGWTCWCGRIWCGCWKIRRCWRPHWSVGCQPGARQARSGGEWRNWKLSGSAWNEPVPDW